ncbi:VPLPA-CTERM sorting domain-containing protein [Actibacterium sp. 188UL27-1]|nr:VPLPA-CTERM sorting domain-containing protein [Actibacterium sp. 188UL27-1]
MIAGGASAAVIDFETFAAGDVVTSFTAGGVTGTVSAVGGAVNQAMVFDSNNFTGGDDDLEAPFYDSFTGSTHNGTPTVGAATLNPGKILIVSEDGDASDPDDNGTGGKITFNFDQAIRFTGFDVLDDVTNFKVTSDTGESISGLSLDYDNQFQSFSGLGWAGVTSLTFDFGAASGAIDNISFEVSAVPLPASLPLLLAGFAAVGFVSRRQRAT